MASVKYGCITPSVETKEYAVAASQYFYHDGSSFVYLDGSGNVTLGLSATTTLIGYAIVPKGKGAGTSNSYWLSSATTGADKIAVITDPKARYLVPSTATVTAGMKGDTADLGGVNDGTQQYIRAGTQTLDVLIIEDVGTSITGGAATDGVVKINPTKFQADT